MKSFHSLFILQHEVQKSYFKNVLTNSYLGTWNKEKNVERDTGKITLKSKVLLFFSAETSNFFRSFRFDFTFYLSIYSFTFLYKITKYFVVFIGKLHDYIFNDVLTINISLIISIHVIVWLIYKYLYCIINLATYVPIFSFAFSNMFTSVNILLSTITENNKYFLLIFLVFICDSRSLFTCF